ncbi:hypothetical protein LEP1GSC103_3709 [Leptospira borgpetersenii serovar Javanica str. UI 09931]|uniref:Uncharacterized protein n=5 Tax=Leptospira borgpetersenii TaxID=174 RepID=M3HQD1_LEPBO|nr:hypothetical protein LBBP_00908 [Leptospira borgpetersenii serovar Ballum]EKP13572.1 hypothetical protein LEP1GSC128_2625 [Leptospira borgpetersenii str. 200801926]EKQ93163.1 hypothetical protein LEP1GSC101_3846 [Leptospira borgpetersenii str. UI 09149]EKQ98445.1 hypothetical protein LEP1GSC121_3366 [Leptospira borgpetersenii serovar Castellonis str. 200801910]EMF99864.1 hypothetical protein LEP1GSC123_3582 [Leptospira borgpetersenii str. 200701203]EMK09910.1 hypothetical protein LEP1GSC066
MIGKFSNSYTVNTERRFQFFPKKVFLSFFLRLISTARGIYK